MLSVIISTKDRPEVLRETLNYLWDNPGFPIEIVVIDCSTIENREEMLDYPIHTLLSDSRGNRSRSRNLALSASNGKYKIIVDDDIHIVEDEWAKKIVESLNEDKDYIQYFAWYPAITREVANKVRFDERFTGYGCEDVDFTIQVKELLGIKEPTRVEIHCERVENELSSEQHEQNLQNKKRLFEKWGERGKRELEKWGEWGEQMEEFV